MKVYQQNIIQNSPCLSIMTFTTLENTIQFTENMIKKACELINDSLNITWEKIKLIYQNLEKQNFLI